jgi:hypothetical protein
MQGQAFDELGIDEVGASTSASGLKVAWYGLQRELKELPLASIS